MSLPTAELVDGVAADLGVTFHPDFREYLLKASNLCVGSIEPVCLVPEDAHNSFQSVLQHARNMGVPPDLLPICEDNSDFYVMDERGVV